MKLHFSSAIFLPFLKLIKFKIEGLNFSWRLLLVSIILFASTLLAQIPQTISYQGILTDSKNNPKQDGDYTITFSFYEVESGGDPIWTESKTLNVSKGLFSTLLGDQVPFGSNVKFDKPYFLGIKVGDEPELSPRIALTSTGYSFSSIISDTSKNIIDGKVVKSLNGLRDEVTLEGSGGTTINKSGNKITISSSSVNGGIQKIINTDSTINITNPNGSTTTLNLNVPVALNGSPSDGKSVISGTNISGSGDGVVGQSSLGRGVFGKSSDGFGVRGESDNNIGVYGESKSKGKGVTSATGVYGVSSNLGVYGITNGKGVGVYGVGSESSSIAVVGHNTLGTGVVGSTGGSEPGVWGVSESGAGMLGETAKGYYGIYGHSPSGAGVAGESDGYGLLGKGHGNYGVGIYATSDHWYAGDFQGNVHVNGTLSKSAGSFKIDHPLDPANKYLSHSFVESPDMMNIYNGNITTDLNGNATIFLPDWFEALNKDFRYQLTVIGEFSQAIVESKIQNNQFRVKTDKPNVEVSWQVTGIRKDAYAESYRIKVEELKPERERGKYLHPELYGQSKEMGINYINPPEVKRITNETMLQTEQLNLQNIPSLINKTKN